MEVKTAIRRAPIDIVNAFKNHPYWHVRKNGSGTFDILAYDGSWRYVVQGADSDALMVWYTAVSITTCEEGSPKREVPPHPLD